MWWGWLSQTDVNCCFNVGENGSYCRELGWLSSPSRVWHHSESCTNLLLNLYCLFACSLELIVCLFGAEDCSLASCCQIPNPRALPCRRYHNDFSWTRLSALSIPQCLKTTCFHSWPYPWVTEMSRILVHVTISSTHCFFGSLSKFLILQMANQQNLRVLSMS